MKRPLAEEFEDVSPSEEICALNRYIDYLEEQIEGFHQDLAGEDW